MQGGAVQCGEWQLQVGWCCVEGGSCMQGGVVRCGGRHGSIPSRFLSEIPENLLKKVGGVREVERKMSSPSLGLDEFGEKKRRIVQDWEIAEETKDDFAEIDNW